MKRTVFLALLLVFGVPVHQSGGSGGKSYAEILHCRNALASECNRPLNDPEGHVCLVAFVWSMLLFR